DDGDVVVADHARRRAAIVAVQVDRRNVPGLGSVVAPRAAAARAAGGVVGREPPDLVCEARLSATVVVDAVRGADENAPLDQRGRADEPARSEPHPEL